MAAQLILLCGRAFSGKSTVAAALADSLDGRVVSFDAINDERGLDGGQGIPLDEWSRTNEMARDRVETLLGADLPVILDDTSSPRFLRDGWRQLCSQAGIPMMLIFVDTPLEIIRERLAHNRTTGTRNDVIDEVMEAHLASFEAPGDDEGAVRIDPTTDLSLTNLLDHIH